MSQELLEKIGRLELDVTVLKQKLAYHPEPGTSPALSELHEYVLAWAKRHKLSREESAHLQACLLAGRLSVNKSLAAVKALLPTHPEDEHWPAPVPRKPWLEDDSEPEGDRDFLENNAELAVLLLEKYIEDKRKEE